MNQQPPANPAETLSAAPRTRGSITDIELALRFRDCSDDDLKRIETACWRMRGKITAGSSVAKSNVAGRRGTDNGTALDSIRE